jgi:hypothetical protein
MFAGVAFIVEIAVLVGCWILVSRRPAPRRELPRA